MDACKSIEWDPRYPKGYYRRAVANFALGKYKAALEDFTRVLQLVPNDTDALAKKKECEKRMRELAFAKAIDSDAVKPCSAFDTIDYESIPVEDSYTGPRWERDEDIKSFCDQLIEYLRNQGRLHRKYLIKLLCYSKRYFGKKNVDEHLLFLWKHRSIEQYRILSSERMWIDSLWRYARTIL
jgi:serine/threonine-protein phosphatase 5